MHTTSPRLNSAHWAWTLLLGVALLLAGALYSGNLMRAARTNLDGLSAAATCLAGDSTHASPAPSSWFAAFVSHCQGDPHPDWESTLVTYPQRISFVRAAKPDSLELASFAAQIHPQQAPAHFWLAALLKQAGDAPAAISAYQAGLGLDPRDANAWYALGQLQEAQGDMLAAVKAYDQACLRVDRGKNGCPNAGRLHMQYGAYALAEASFRSSLAQLPGWLPAQKGLAAALLAQGQTDQAIPYLTRLAQAGDAEAQATLQALGVPLP